MAIYWMVSYSILVFCLFELACIHQLNDVRIKQVLSCLFFLSAIVLIIFGGIRGPGSGLDDWQYLGFFSDFSSQLQVNSYATITDVYRYEKVFMLLAWFFSFFTKESYYFLFFICFIAVSTNAVLYKKYSPLILCSLCLYSAHLFINKDMNQIRFGLCSAFAIAFICLLSQRKIVLAIVFFVLSSQSHSTGYALLLLLPFCVVKERKYYPLLMVLCAIPLGMIGGKKLFLDSLGIVPVLGDRAMGYNGTNFDVATPVLSLANFKNIFFIGFFTFFYFKNGIKKYDYLTYLLLVAYAIGAAVRITFADFSIIGGRVGNLYLHAEPLLVAFLMMRIRHFILNAGILFAMVSYYLAYNTILSAQSISGYNIAPLFKIF